MIDDALTLSKRTMFLFDELGKAFDRTDINTLEDELITRSQWYPESAVMLAQAEYILDKQRATVAEELMKDATGVGAHQFKVALEGATADYKRLFNQVSKLYSVISKQQDNLRTLISAEKEAMRVSR